MIFGLYIHTSGPGGLIKKVGSEISRSLGLRFSLLKLSEIDGLFIGIAQTSNIETGFKVRKKKIRRDYTLKLITGGTEHYQCMVELDINVPDAEVIDNTTEEDMRAYIRNVLIELTPKLFAGFPDADLLIVKNVFEAM